MSSRIPRGRVRKQADSAMIASGGDGADDHPIAVIPLRDGNSIAGFEVRCRCGSRAVVDCVYDEAESPPSDPSNQDHQQAGSDAP